MNHRSSSEAMCKHIHPPTDVCFCEVPTAELLKNGTCPQAGKNHDSEHQAPTLSGPHTANSSQVLRLILNLTFGALGLPYHVKTANSAPYPGSIWKREGLDGKERDHCGSNKPRPHRPQVSQELDFSLDVRGTCSSDQRNKT